MLAFVGNLSCGVLFSISSWAFFPLHFLLWFLVDLDVYASIAGHTIRQEGFQPFFLAWIGRETLAFPIWILAIFGDEVVWRGSKYQILQNGEARITT
jgi:ceramide glucosyltransferase